MFWLDANTVGLVEFEYLEADGIDDVLNVKSGGGGADAWAVLGAKKSLIDLLPDMIQILHFGVSKLDVAVYNYRASR